MKILTCLMLSLYSHAFIATPPNTVKSHPINHGSRTRLKMAAGKEANNIISRITYRCPTADEIPAYIAIESASYPADEAASLEGLTYRQSHAGDYFLGAYLNENDDSAEMVIGFICGTRCDQFEEESMSTHTPTGPYLAIHSVVVHQDYRRKGIASDMLKEYLKCVKKQEIELQDQENGNEIQSVVLLAKSHLLGFYVNCGFQVIRPSPIVHGKELWYELEQKILPATTIQSLPQAGESWFVKTETFKQTFPYVKPHLEAHKEWVHKLRKRAQHPVCITSGYRVDADGNPGGGGLMFLAAKNYDEALQLVLQDPLVANDCVDWQLNGWIGQVGDVQMR